MVHNPDGTAPGIDLSIPREGRGPCRLFALPGEAVCVPDLVFTNDATGEEVFLEAFGFWSRQAVWQRLETIERGFPSPIILAVGKQLRVSEAALEDRTSADLYVYRTTMRPKAILERLERR